MNDALAKKPTKVELLKELYLGDMGENGPITYAAFPVGTVLEIQLDAEVDRLLTAKVAKLWEPPTVDTSVEG